MISKATQSVTITGYNSYGEGVARLDDGRVVFVRGAARGDVLEIAVYQELSKIARADIVRVLTPSPHRIEPDCVLYPDCGGCDYRHITYEEELFAKLQCVNDALKRIGGLSVQVDEVLHTGKIDSYRNKVVLHSDGSSFGFYRTRSHDIVHVNRCLLLKDDLNNAIKELTASGFGTKSELTLRSGRKGVSQPLEEELDGLVFSVEGFFQINAEAALLLFQKAREYAALSKCDTLVDLYCGVGALTLFIGRDAGTAIGVEQNADAVKAARENALQNNLSHVVFINADAADWTVDLTEPDCVIVDPPRKGLSPKAISNILELSPKRLVYVSCNPATMARDFKEFNRSGYEVKDICAVDMFPRTANVECCCLLAKEEVVTGDGALSQMEEIWIKIDISTTSEGVDVLTSALFDLGYHSLSVVDASDLEKLIEGKYGAWDYIDPELMKLGEVETSVTFYVPGDSDTHDRLDEINGMLQRLKTSDVDGKLGKLECSFSSVVDENWDDKWKEDYEPINIGDKLVVCPTWLDFDEGDRVVLRIDPGMAFGTGLDETTRLCLEALERMDVGGCSVLDIGCGSGILAIGALLLGAVSALGIDIDETAVNIAKENAELNGVAGASEFVHGSPVDLITKKFDVVFTNIAADAILSLMPEFPRFLNDTGVLILSGIIESREQDIINALLDNSINIIEQKIENGWCCITAKLL